jgi:phospholipase C
MRCLNPLQRAPVLAHLALQFAVCDRWFSSVPGETWPNRNFAHAATSDGATNIELGFYYDRTIFEQLASVGASWRIYHDGQAQAWCFRNLWRVDLTWWDRIRGRMATVTNWHEQSEFADHVRAGDLPAYAFIEPTHMAELGEPRDTNSQHPDNNRQGSADFYAGEALIKEVYEALVSNAPLFEKTLLLVTYDEHGGFVDHVPPPAAIPPGGHVLRSWSRRLGILGRALLARLQGRTPPAADTFAFDRLGVRVPAVLVSPWITPGTVVHTQLDHASIPATLRALFAPGLPSLGARDAQASTFHGVVRRYGLPSARTLARFDGGPVAASSVESVRLQDAPAAVAGLSTPAGKGPQSKVDQQLAHLGQQVHRELQSSGAAAIATAGAPRTGTPQVGFLETTPPVYVGDVFADVARAAREKEMLKRRPA